MSTKGNFEIERKWLVARDGVLPEACRTLIAQHSRGRSTLEQGYFFGSGADNSVRIRKAVCGGEVKCFITTKSDDRESGVARCEYENEIFVATFDALWPLTEGRRILKTRYRIPCGDHMAEVDVYGGRLEGLVIAEVEFKTEADALAFEAPGWFGADVTRDRRFKNHELALSQKVPEVG